ncbi:metallophosphoesterase [Alphaproteobacteria bacterium]|nr:metallophosphoesterase [Alphaproteobacteria bacterium]
MRILFCGDIVGRSGRDLIEKHIGALRKSLSLDFVVVNGENASHGFGVTAKHCAAFFSQGVDVVTLGNHSWDQRDIIPYMESESRVIRPINYPPGTPGRGFGVFSDARGRKILVAQAMGRLFMDPLDDPFAALSCLLGRYALGGAVQGILVDLHAEASSEKMALGHFLDGRVSAALGSHTHIPTADARVLPKGSAYLTDAGMCGDYDSVIGMKKEASLSRFVRKMPGERLEPADGGGALCGAVVETDDATGLALSIEPIRIGDQLQGTHDFF